MSGALGCADKAPPARFPDPSPPVLAKPIELTDPSPEPDSRRPADGPTQTDQPAKPE